MKAMDIADYIVYLKNAHDETLSYVRAQDERDAVP